MPYLNDQFEAYTLGETAGPIEVTGQQQLKDITLDMAQQSRRLIQIVSRHLDSAVYDNSDFADAITALVRRSRYTEVQILVHDSVPAVKDGHQLINLHQRLSTFIQIRQIHNDYQDYNEALYLVDETAYIRRQFADRFEAIADYHAPLQVRQYAKLFSDIWNISPPDSQIRRLHI